MTDHIEKMAKAQSVSMGDKTVYFKDVQAAFDALMDAVPDLVWSDDGINEVSDSMGLEYTVGHDDTGSIFWHEDNSDTYEPGFVEIDSAKYAANTHRRAQVCKIWEGT